MSGVGRVWASTSEFPGEDHATGLWIPFSAAKIKIIVSPGVVYQSPKDLLELLPIHFLNSLHSYNLLS